VEPLGGSENAIKYEFRACLVSEGEWDMLEKERL
jgi:hypothetical protein